MNVIEDKVIKVEKIAWKNLNWLQSETLKDPVDINKLVKSLSENGLIRGFHVWEDEKGEIWILDGHHMEKALKIIEKEELLAIPEKLTCYFIKCADKKEAAKMVLLHSASYAKITSEGTWEHLSRFDINPAELNTQISIDTFDFNEIEKLANQGIENEAEEDEFEVPDEIQTDIELGDLIEIGRHRLLCGSSTKSEDVEKLMDGKKGDLLLTDPPYNVDYVGQNGMKIQNDNMDDSSFLQFLSDFFKSYYNHIKDGGAIYIWHADSEGYNFRKAFKESGFLLKQCLIWVKSSLVLGRQDYQWRHEPCLYGWKPGAAHYFTHERNHTTIIDDQIDYSKLTKPQLLEEIEKLNDQFSQSTLYYDKPSRSDSHPTMKPIPLFAQQAKNSSKENQIIVDGFAGSGTTIVVSHQLNRIAYLMENDPKYCQVIIDRMLLLDPEIEVKINGEIYKSS